MALEPQDVANAELDIDTIGAFVNGSPSDDVTNRAGATFPSLQKIIASSSASGRRVFATLAERDEWEGRPPGAQAYVSDTDLSYRWTGTTGGWVTFKDPTIAAADEAMAARDAMLPLLDRFELSANWYLDGRKVVAGFIGSDRRLGWAIMPNGEFRAKLAVQIDVANGLEVIQTTGGVTKLRLGSVEGVLPLGSEAKVDTTGRRFYAGQRVIWAATDRDLRGGVVMLADGTVSIPKLQSPALDRIGLSPAVDAPDHVFEVIAVDGKSQIARTRKSTGARNPATGAGNNYAPRLSADGSRVIYLTDRNGAPESYYQRADGGRLGGAVEHPVIPRARLHGTGDSLTAAGYLESVAALLGTTTLYPASSPESGIGSQNAQQIAARHGAKALTCSVQGAAVVAGANTLTAISTALLSRAADVVGTVRSLPCWLAGVPGVLTATHSATATPGALQFTANDFYTYIFTPDAGQALPQPAPAGSVLEINPKDRQDVVAVIWIGRNNVGQANWSADVKAEVAAMVASQKSLARRFVVIGVTNSTSEPAGSAAFNAIVQHNADLAALYPDNFVDVRPAFNNGGDVPAAVNTNDGLHYNNTGKAAIAAAVASYLQPKGWF